MSAPVPVEQLNALRGAIAWLADDDSTPAPMLERLRSLLASLEARPTGDEVIEPLLGWVAGIWPSLATELRTAIQQIEAAPPGRDDPREVGWMAASKALGYEARKEGTKADVALWFWTAAAWLEQHKE